MSSIYVLKCENNKYYIGKTKDIESRYNDHCNGNGSEFTKKYKPIKIIDIIKNADEFEEDKQVKKYMSKYGIENVRGGSYSTIKLLDYQIKALEKELLSSSNKCFKCGEEGHYVNECDKLMINKLKKELELKDKRIKELEQLVQTSSNKDDNYLDDLIVKEIENIEKNAKIEEVKYIEEPKMKEDKDLEEIYNWCYDNSIYMIIWLFDMKKMEYYYCDNKTIQKNIIQNFVTHLEIYKLLFPNDKQLADPFPHCSNRVNEYKNTNPDQYNKVINSAEYQKIIYKGINNELTNKKTAIQLYNTNNYIVYIKPRNYIQFSKNDIDGFINDVGNIFNNLY
jgi:predicted GIY-YIG superfamily endonuclease